ncbi:MAG TPA: hypothetical protein VMS43_12570 [Allosphingosinicella sp.]|nr:hypothetical protein [Allosphingosinicella sp.]
MLALALAACSGSATTTNIALEVNEDLGLEGNLTSVDNLQNVSSNGSEPAVAQAACARQPANGARLEGRRLSGHGHVLEIRNGAAGDAIVKVRNADNGRLVTAFYVAQNRTGSLSGIPDGNYSIQYAFGSPLAEDCKSFANITSAGEFPGPTMLAAESLGDQVSLTQLTYTLYSVPDGNTVPTPLDPSAFNRD